VHWLFFAQTRDGCPVSACFHRVASANGRAQAKKPRRVRQQRSYNPHDDLPVVVSIMRYLQDVRVTNYVTMQGGQRKE
jgi:hypothetical protein